MIDVEEVRGEEILIVCQIFWQKNYRPEELPTPAVLCTEAGPGRATCVSSSPLYTCLAITDNAAFESREFPLGVSVWCWCTCWTESCVFIQFF